MHGFFHLDGIGRSTRAAAAELAALLRLALLGPSLARRTS
jgi:hypothetical protein